MEKNPELRAARDRCGGGRQYAYRLGEVKPNHVARYEWAVERLADDVDAREVVDFCSGVGYGAHVLAEAGYFVQAVEGHPGAHEFAKKHWAHPRVHHLCAEAHTFTCTEKSCAAVVAFECLEHLADPQHCLERLRAVGRLLFASVPNADAVPHDPERNPYHARAYSGDEFFKLLKASGWSAECLAYFDAKGVHVDPGREKRGFVVMARGSQPRGDGSFKRVIESYFKLLAERSDIISKGGKR